MQTGWIKLHRQMQDDGLWLSESFTKSQAWIDLLMAANHKAGFIDVRGFMINVRRGQVGWSEETMAKRWKWSRGKVKRYLTFLMSLDRITVQRASQYKNIITICNYCKYQDDDTTNGTANDTTNEPRTNHERYTTKNVNNDKNEKKINGRFKKPSLDEVAAYCTERGNAVNPEKFIAYYESNGWKVGKNPMKNWKAAITGTWEKEKKKSFAKTVYNDRTSL